MHIHLNILISAMLIFVVVDAYLRKFKEYQYQCGYNSIIEVSRMSQYKYNKSVKVQSSVSQATFRFMQDPVCVCMFIGNNKMIKFDRLEKYNKRKITKELGTFL